MSDILPALIAYGIGVIVGWLVFRSRLATYRARLRRIVAQETPGANATVRRCIRIARGK